MSGKTYRYRFSVPDRDAIVRQWIAEQEHLSMSLRALIKEDIARNGLEDVMCRMPEQPVRRGRPPGSGKAWSEEEPEEAEALERPQLQPRRSRPVPRPAAKPVAEAPAPAVEATVREAPAESAERPVKLEMPPSEPEERPVKPEAPKAKEPERPVGAGTRSSRPPVSAGGGNLDRLEAAANATTPDMMRMLDMPEDDPE